MKSYLAGALSGLIEVSCTHPIDYIKTKKQQNISIRDILRETPFKQYYSGYVPRLLGIIPVRLTFWGTQQSIETILKNKNVCSWYKFMYIGTGAACAQTIVDTPIEVLKIAYMNQAKGSSSLLKGFYPTLYRNILFTNCVALANQQNKTRTVQTKLTAFVYAGMGGFIGSVMSQPLDYVKTQKQLPQPDPRTMMEMLKKESIQTLFRGGGFRALLGMSTMSIGYCAYIACL
jgi:hypothetical protein